MKLPVQMERLEEVREKARNREITRKEAAEMLGVSIDYLYKRQKNLGLDDINWLTVSEKYPKELDPRYMHYATQVSNGEISVRAAADALGISPPAMRTWMDRHGIYRAKTEWKGKEGNPCCECGEVWCEWLQSGKPVPGWNAKKVRKSYGGAVQDGYSIISCPKFKPPKKRNSRVKRG